MKNIKILFTALIIGFSINSNGQNLVISTMNDAGAATTFASSAKILVAMTISKDKDLRFGTIMIATDLEATVILAPNGGLTYGTGLSAGVTAYDEATSPAEFTITGSPANTYGVMLSGGNTITVTNTQTDASITDETMIISDLKLSFDGGTTSVDVTANQANLSTIGATANATHVGTSTFTLGGTLTVKALQAGGTYVNNSTDIFVDYN